MCGRFVGYRNLEALKAHFPIDRVEATLIPNYNVAPTQMIPAIVRQDDENVPRTFKWGLVPFWVKDPSIGNKMINARSETVESKPSFRNAFQKRRCLIPADGFYEWKGPKGSKQPVFITLPGEELFGFAGLWEVWDDKGKAEEPPYTCTIITTDASPSIQEIHHRMPVILTPEAFEDWIEESTDTDALKEILRSQFQKELAFRPVSKAVNKVDNNSVKLIKEAKPR
jgi:putative SOS response-associated peptidase YedK